MSGRVRGLLVGVAAASLTAGLLGVVGPLASPAAAVVRGSGDEQDADGRPSAPVVDIPNPEATINTPPVVVEWPEPAEAAVALTDDGLEEAEAAVDAGVPVLDATDVPADVSDVVEVGAPEEAAAASLAAESATDDTTGTTDASDLDEPAPDAVSVEVLDREATGDPSAPLGLRVTSLDDSTAAASVDVSIDYSGFRTAFGGDWVSRLRLVQVPECALVTPEAPECSTRTVLPTTNDVESGLISATVPVDSEPVAAAADPSAPSDLPSTLSATAESGPIGGGMVTLLAASNSSSAGSYRATDLSTAGAWDVSPGSGAFTYSVPIEVPVPPAGSAPSVALSYNSQSVDGRTSATNNQSSWVGMGWDLQVGYIERRFMSCVEDAGAGSAGDLCWESANEAQEPNGSVMTINLNGVSTALIQEGTGTGRYHLQDDPGWRVQRIGSGGFGAVDDYWVVSTPDGTRYYFGYGRSERKPADSTQSVWTVPVVGNDAGEPCHGQYPTPCDQAWRWNLDRVVDPNEVEQALFYDREVNHYRSVIANDTSRAYDAGGYLTRIEYGWTSKVAGWYLPAQVVFQHVNRCEERTAETDPLRNGIPTCPSITASPSSYPDVPGDLICDETGSSGCQTPDNRLFAPTFFIKDMLWSITTQTRTSDSANWADVMRYHFKYGFPAATGGTKALWLDYIQREGRDGGSKILPSVNFNGTNYDNLVGGGSGNTLEFRRITTIINALGGKTDIAYSDSSSPNACVAGNLPPEDNNDTECWKARWVEDGVATWDWFRKRVVTEVTNWPRVAAGAANPASITRYSYEGKPGWRFSNDPLTPNDKESWSEWRGYERVMITVGEGSGSDFKSRTRYRMFRGLDGDRLNKDGSGQPRDESVNDSNGTSHDDSPWLAGRVLEVERLSGPDDSDLTSTTRTTYWVHNTAQYAGLPDARYVRPASVRTRERVGTTTNQTNWRTHVVDTEYDSTYGQVTQVTDNGEGGVTDGRCTVYSYARNTDDFGSGLQRWMVGYVEDVEQYDAECAITSKNKTAHTITFFDQADSASTNKPFDGNVTETRTYTSSSTYLKTTRVVDEVGREESTTTGLTNAGTGAFPQTTATAYIPDTGWPTSGVVVTNALEQTTTTVMSRAWGVPLSVTDTNGKVTTVNLDAAGRTTAATRNGEAKQAVKYTYLLPVTAVASDPPDMVVDAPSVTTETWVSGTGSTAVYRPTVTFYDGFGKVREVQRVSPKPGTPGRIVEVTWYNDRGLVAGTSAPTWDNASLMNGSSPRGILNPDRDATNGIKSFTETGYDALSRPITSKLYDGATVRRTTTMSYDAGSSTVNPPIGGNTVTLTDVWGRTTAVREYKSGALMGSGSLRTYTPNGQLASVTDNSGALLGFTYDWAGRRTGVSDPDAGASTTVFDAAGNAVRSTDAKGQVVSTTFDALNRPTLVFKGTDPNAANVKISETVYDSYVDRGGVTRTLKGVVGRVTRFDGSGNGYVHRFQGYDNRYRVTQDDYVLPASIGTALSSKKFEYSYGYDYTDALTSVTMPAMGSLAAETLTTVIDPASGFETALTTSDSSVGAYVDAAVYTGSGLLDSRTWGRGVGSGKAVRRTLSYDMATRLPVGSSTRVGAYASVGSGSLVQDRTFGYDAVDNPVRVTDLSVTQASVPLSECFSFDGRSRLTRAYTSFAAVSGSACPAPGVTGAGPGGYDVSWTLKDNGNIDRVDQAKPTVVSSVYGYDAARPHAVTSVTAGSTTKTIGYDANGAVSQRKTGSSVTDSFVFDATHTMVSHTQASVTTTHVPGPDGTRIARIDGTGPRVVFLPGLEVRAATANASSVSATRYYTFAGSTVAMRTGTGNAGLTWLTGDRAGSTELAVKAGSDSVTIRRYTPYGAPRSTLTGTAAQAANNTMPTTPTTLPTVRGYLGKPEDPTGLVALDHRGYDPTLMRFLNPDPSPPPTTPPPSTPTPTPSTTPSPTPTPPGCCPQIATQSASATIRRTRRRQKAALASVRVVVLEEPPPLRRYPTLLTRA